MHCGLCTAQYGNRPRQATKHVSQSNNNKQQLSIKSHISLHRILPKYLHMYTGEKLSPSLHILAFFAAQPGPNNESICKPKHSTLNTHKIGPSPSPEGKLAVCGDKDCGTGEYQA